MIMKCKNVRMILNYIGQLPISVSAIVFAFASLVGVSIGIVSFLVGLKSCAIAAEI